MEMISRNYVDLFRSIWSLYNNVIVCNFEQMLTSFLLLLSPWQLRNRGSAEHLKNKLLVTLKSSVYCVCVCAHTHNTLSLCILNALVLCVWSVWILSTSSRAVWIPCKACVCATIAKEGTSSGSLHNALHSLVQHVHKPTNSYTWSQVSWYCCITNCQGSSLVYISRSCLVSTSAVVALAL